MTTRGSLESVLEQCKVTGNERKEVTGFRERVIPGNAVSTVFQLLLVGRVAVGKQDRITLPVGLDRRCEPRHHIRSIRVPGDTSKSLCLALGAEHVT